jgi:hypothetical protein
MAAPLDVEAIDIAPQVPGPAAARKGGREVVFEKDDEAPGAKKTTKQKEKAQMVRVETFVMKSQTKLPIGYLAAFLLYATAVICGLYCLDAGYLYNVSKDRRETALANFVERNGPAGQYGGMSLSLYDVVYSSNYQATVEAEVHRHDAWHVALAATVFAILGVVAVVLGTKIMFEWRYFVTHKKVKNLELGDGPLGGAPVRVTNPVVTTRSA